MQIEQGKLIEGRWSGGKGDVLADIVVEQLLMTRNLHLAGFKKSLSFSVQVFI
jgi:hypothetical protein